MPPDETTNGAAAPQQEQQPAPLTLREVAERAYDQHEADDLGTDQVEGQEPISGQDDRPRDKQGRFAAKPSEAQPGEQPDPNAGPAPSADPNQQQQPQPAQPGTDAPAHWNEQHRQMFAKLPADAKSFLLDRHRDMEADYTRKTQAAATAVQFTQQLAPIFQDPAIAGEMQRAGVSPLQAIHQWASYQVRATHPDVRVRQALYAELGQRMGLQPSGNGQVSQPVQGLSEEDLKDPAIRFFADNIGATTREVQALKQQLAEAANARAVEEARWKIDQVADEKDAQGKPLRPDFDALMPAMMKLLAADPSRDIREVYEEAGWLHPETRDKRIAARAAAARQQQDVARARQAVKSNVRGQTAPVKAPPGDGKSLGLRGTIEAAADEIGM